MTRAFLALGSNIGNRAGHLQDAVEGLGAVDGVRVVGVSKVYETEPVGPPQDDYLNAVVAIETDLDAHDLLAVARSLETAAGRAPDSAGRVRWGPRELDVDVLLVGAQRVDAPDLVVPHPRIGERPFVLAPLADLAPDLPIVEDGRRRFQGRWPGVRVTDVELRIR